MKIKFDRDTCIGIFNVLTSEMTLRKTLTKGKQIYRRNRPSASGLDPEGEGRKPR